MFRARFAITLLAACLATLIAGLLPGGAGAMAAEPVGRVVHHEGIVMVLREAGATALATGAPVYADDRIFTNVDARARVALVDGGTLSIGPGSLVVVEDFRAAGEGPLEATVSLFLGIIRAVIPEAAADEGRFDVRTRAAIASVRSTRFIVSATEGGSHTAVFVIDGVVAVAATAPGGDTVLLDDGEGVDIDIGETALQPVRWGEARVRRVLALTGPRE